MDRLQSLPGVVAASASVTTPLTGGLMLQRVRAEGYQFRPGEDDSAVFSPIAPRFFAVTGTPLLLGRDFNERDAAGSNPVAIVNQTFAREFFGGQPPLGRHVTSNNVTYEIVGRVQDSKYDLRKGIPKMVYISWTQQGNVGESNRSQPTGFTYLARVASGDPLSSDARDGTRDSGRRFGAAIAHAADPCRIGGRIDAKRAHDGDVRRILRSAGADCGVASASSACWHSRFRAASMNWECAWLWAPAEAISSGWCCAKWG